MKSKILTLLTVLFLIGLSSSCVSVKSNKNGIPPGQAKKITGSQSAAPYAPGHNK